ncbi:hypothetical protein PV325_003161 [Microctonus aethiopoides]|uniref:TsaA-like domain-containing protein n=1 Tax=Microctonus aethiopoides TaxID=144406 RepID=A0AA39FYP3_9HYME|nr:hypothetical protein PV325_003161 [Microctonus aethiopoides]KAK0095194.1 hypothetical protein PV326_009016 [Microctonus aethiopoides]KAK0178297.1 hypothetical protein PV328_002261 [Microctonus aethiopoides]
MDTTHQYDELNPKYLLGQLNTARKEINNLRQQIKSLRYVFDKDMSGIKRLIDLHTNRPKLSPEPVTHLEVESTSSSQSNSLILDPIGIINTGFPSKRGTPRQSTICKQSRGKITLYNSVFTNPEHALDGLQEFSHMWILFNFHKNNSMHVRAKVAPPRLNGVRTGVFSTRSPHRPCPIGLSLVKIIKIENNTILFEGVDTVDGTPVLDIKPYIPQYDNPLHVEKCILRENNPNSENPLEGLELETSRLNPAYNDFDSTDDHDGRYYSSIPNDTSQMIDISYDEEIALRLQAEEFAERTAVDDFNVSRSHSPSLDIIPLMDNISINLNSQNVDQDNPGPSNQENTADQNSIRSDISVEHANDIIQNINLESHDMRNSRLLDGADGSSTVYGIDVDLINRRTLNSRLDNSPVRMGIREAPDGEEGLQSQSLRSSNTTGNIQSIPANTNSSFANYSSRGLNIDVENTDFQVRVPDWITQPRSRSLSVIFNDRALRQLNDIVHDKAEEQKRAIINVLREDPRSVYLRQRWANQFYTFLIHDLHISCRFDDNRGVVTVFQIRHAGRTCECGEPEWQCLGHSPI